MVTKHRGKGDADRLLTDHYPIDLHIDHLISRDDNDSQRDPSIDSEAVTR